MDSKHFFSALQSAGMSFFTGVPDSSLKHFCAYVTDHTDTNNHVITANEGNAIALAAGHYLGSGSPAMVYMQNSGIGNAINPLLSLADREVYSIPMLLMVGWRGEPGVPDEPQHIKQGRVTQYQLDLMEIPYRILQADTDIEKMLAEVFSIMQQTSAPVALLVRRGSFAKYVSKSQKDVLTFISREEALAALLEKTDSNDLIVSTTGKTSRELYELRNKRGENQADFLTVGSMGHTSSIALGVALTNPSRRVICLDGDGSAIMHLGAIPIIGSLKPRNLVHVILNNCAHESVGGQPTVADEMSLSGISKACGYQGYCFAQDIHGINQAWAKTIETDGPVMLEIRISIQSRSDLGRPTKTPIQTKASFMKSVNS